ncbi:MAG: hypothetical protein IKV35_00735 [Clostridia bacterium]|nr:hypothetical protein [Clostridia bacterium]
MKRLFAGVLLCWMLFAVGCASAAETAPPIDAVGRWQARETDSYYFELDADGSCIMFSSDDEWVSAGTYEAYADHIAFSMDTGSFTWVIGEEPDVLIYEAGGYRYHYQKV